MTVARHRVAIYACRDSAIGRELLVFDHVDVPEAGTQIPAGGIVSGEGIEDAAIREVREETGIDDLRGLTILGTQDLPSPDTDTARFTTFIRASTQTNASEWLHRVSSGKSEDNDMIFRCYFVPLEIAADILWPEQREFLQGLSRQ